MSQAENDELTRIGADRPAGRLLRRYWMPAALTEELAGARPVVPVRLLGEDLVLFRQPSGALGLLGRHCPHRGVDLCYGRLEANGLRCPFHGWYFDASGQCLEQPAEPADSTAYRNIRARAYPVVENNGIVWAYLGPGEPPAFPALDCFVAPGSHVFAFKGLWECNWLQATEIGIDPAHASFLHRFLADEDPADAYGKQFRDSADESRIPMTRLLREHPSPTLELEDTRYGMRIAARRTLPDGRVHVRVTHQLFPCAICIPMSREMNITQWHVPLDDGRTYWYAMFTSFTDPVDKALMRAQRLEEHRLPDYRPVKNASNRYGYDAEEQAGLTYTGMGADINVHDQWAVESMGRIQDRTAENPASSDRAIIRFRRALRAAIRSLESRQAEPPPAVFDRESAAAVRGPVAIDVIVPAGEAATAWHKRDAERRGLCPWPAGLDA